VTRLLKPVKSFLHRLGVRFSIYVDDGRIAAATAESCLLHLCFTLHVSQLAGWRVQWKKTMIHPTTRLLHLGFITDSVTMTYSITPDKWSSFVAVADTLIAAAASGRPVSVRTLASLLGKLASFRRSHGPIVRVLSRHLQHDLGSHIAIHDWHSSLTLSPAATTELPRLVSLLPSFNHRRISSAAEESLTTAAADLPLPATCPPPPPLSPLHQYRLAVDGSFSHCPDAAIASPGYHLELVTAVAFLSSLASCPPLIYWLSPSRIFCDLVLHGSLDPFLNALVFDLLSICSSFGSEFHPIFSPASSPAIAAADARFALSRSTDEWSIDRQSLSQIFLSLDFHPDVDGFASRFNTVCPVFFSASPQLHSAGVNFFSQVLDPRRRYFICPPPKLLSPALQHCLKFPGVLALFILPDWPSAAFWLTFFPNGRLHENVIAHRRFTPPFFAANNVPSIFTSGAYIPMLALLIKV
jgi:hypothetical protein